MKFEEIAEDVFICEASPDVRAVMGAKTSRASDLEKRWKQLTRKDRAEEKTAQFLQQNLKEYNHASIAEMAETWVHYRNIGWPFAWLVEDTPLFIGQETSTRAVDLTKNKALCHGAPAHLSDTHSAWMDLYESAVNSTEAGDVYALDGARYYLPSSCRTGVTWCGNARVGVRQMEKILGLGGEHGALAMQMLAGMQSYAPECVTAVHRGPRNPDNAWVPRCTMSDDRTEIIDWPGQDAWRRHATLFHMGRKAHREYLDPMWDRLGLFGVRIRCSVAAARDWHRHRRMLPWTVSVVLTAKTEDAYDDYGDLVAPRLVMNEHAAQHVSVSDELWEETSQNFWGLFREEDPWQAMYALPFCAEVELEAYGTLPALLYMLELRATSSGANAEYKAQAIELLKQLETRIHPSFSSRLKILGCLESAEEGEEE